MNAPGKSDDEVFLLLLHHVKKDFDGLLAVVLVVSGIVQVIGLVNQQDTAEGLLDHFLRGASARGSTMGHAIVAPNHSHKQMQIIQSAQTTLNSFAIHFL